ncbi:RING-H2 finger protein ATL80 [Lolium perenne]|jgi:hypothetical protein|uniref:RING-H2 finger protein ATL80 n=1 Tax=Lolium perenne TaxID=4522 RepID=UPI0021EB0BD7|nr:RING-H2 finger protein ATL80-like [Lolium perenne]
MAARRLLLEAAAATQQPDSLSSDLVLILAGLLCALVCVLGLALVARCACSRRWARAAAPSSPPGANRGVKKEVLRALPTVAYAVPEGRAGAEADECAICLAEFEDGQLMRVLPQCGHGFHAPCVDAWLRSHSSCPSCRRVLVAAELPRGEPCGRCGARPGAIGALLKGPCSGGALASLLA